MRPDDRGPAPPNLETLRAELPACRRCELWRCATQAVAGAGPSDAALMLVGEQPGDQEDLAGRPFVGPAGALLDRALTAAGADRRAMFVTNAVKHFKHEPRGKRRLHKTPDAGEVRACRWWLAAELRIVAPRVVVALGATAAKAVLERPVAVTRERGAAGEIAGGALAFVTVHPSSLLRMPDPRLKAAAFETFTDELRQAAALAARRPLK